MLYLAQTNKNQAKLHHLSDRNYNLLPQNLKTISDKTIATKILPYLVQHPYYSLTNYYDQHNLLI